MLKADVIGKFLAKTKYRSMNLKNKAREVKQEITSSIFKLKNLDKEQFDCPVCNYTGAFKDVHPPTGIRKHAACPKCYALERHRIQYLVVDRLLARLDFVMVFRHRTYPNLDNKLPS